MSRRLTTEEFIERAKAVHGDRYDYSSVNYVNNNTKVTIICRDHGPFPQVPDAHLNKASGCPDCAGTKLLTTETFIERAMAVHGDRYDYSSVNYVNSISKVTIICRDHGPFSQTPGNHLSEHGCPDCAGTKPLTTETFIEKAIAVHGERYDYSSVNYVNNNTKVTINCRDHGPFQQTPVAHLAKQGCNDCAGNKPLTTETFIKRAIAVHGERYDYSSVNYVNNNTKVTIICRDHAAFEQRPADHTLAKHGCPDCAGTKLLTTETFIERAMAVHGDRYDYSSVNYVNSIFKVTIICRDHGPFSQTPGSHLANVGCPDCAGNQPLTTETFIEKAIAIHGDRYDYSSVNYVNSISKVTIICPDHGPFSQTPGSHLANAGCPDCGGRKPLTTETFIEKAKAVHGDRYDYSSVNYVDAHTRVTIICPDHGPFSQVPDAHLNKAAGCPDCAGNKPLTTETFIKRAIAVHGDRYDYSSVNYVSNNTKVTIICPTHGAFEQRPADHALAKHGCPDCAGKNTTTESFIEKARAIHGDRYDYLQVNYVNNNTKVTIICRDHGPFQQTPSNHLSKQGCPDCGGRKPLTTETFIEKAKAIHDDRYDYSSVNYINNNTKVTIICPDHGSFQQTPGHHLSEQGCPDCAESGFNSNEPGLLYYVAVTTDNGDTRYKIGITNRTVEERFYGPELARIRIVKTWRYAIGRSAEEREAEILSQNVGDRYYGPDILLSGNSELFTHDILGLDRRDKKNA